VRQARPGGLFGGGGRGLGRGAPHGRDQDDQSPTVNTAPARKTVNRPAAH
jgi:hypothetical protein